MPYKWKQVKIQLLLYIVIQKSENFWNKKIIKTTKREHAFKGFANTYDIEILSSFNLELQLKYTESAIRNKLKNIV